MATENQAPATVQVMTEYPPRLQTSMLAPVRKMANVWIKEGDKEAYTIGYVFGVARGVSWRNNPNATDDSPSGALIGVFEGIPAYQDFEGMEEGDKCKHRSRVASGILFLPDMAQQKIIAAVLGDEAKDRPSGLKRGQRSDKLGVEVPINVEIGVRRANTATGYEFVVRGIANVSAEDPIERMRKAIGTGPGNNLAAIVAAADKPQAALPAPDKSGKDGKPTPPAKGKGKR